MARVRRGKRLGQRSGFLVTWDVNSADRPSARRVHRFVYGETTVKGGKMYRYPGFVEAEGVRYLGQSVLFVPASLLSGIDAFLTRMSVDHEILRVTIG